MRGEVPETTPRAHPRALGRGRAEIEIVEDVLRAPEMAGQARFYLRDPAYIDTLAPDSQATFHEIPTSDGAPASGCARRRRRSPGGLWLSAA